MTKKVSRSFMIALGSLLFLVHSTCFADSIETFFNHDSRKSYTDPYYHQHRIGDNLEKVLLDSINGAKKTIKIAVYELDLPEVAKLLAVKKASGVTVEVVLDNTNSKLFRVRTAAEIAALNEHDQAKYLEFVNFADVNHDHILSKEELDAHDSLAILKNAGIPFIDDTANGSKGSGLMHHKFMIIDDSLLITGSANFTRSCIHGDSNAPETIGNANSMLRIQSASMIKLFDEEFAELWTYHHFHLNKRFRGPMRANIGNIPVIVQFSPTSTKVDWKQSTNGTIYSEVINGKKSADMALFVFSEQNIANALEYATSHGLKPSVLIDPSFATRYYSELLGMFGLQLLDPKCRYKPDNHVWAHPTYDSGFPVLARGDLLHHKFAVIDHRKVLVGSHNWSAAANTINDEALLVIDDPSVAEQYSEEFQRLKAHSVLGPQPWLLKKIHEAEVACHHG